MKKTNILLKQQTQLILLALFTLLLAFTLMATTQASTIGFYSAEQSASYEGDPCCPFSGTRPPTG